MAMTSEDVQAFLLLLNWLECHRKWFQVNCQLPSMKTWWIDATQHDTPTIRSQLILEESCENFIHFMPRSLLHFIQVFLSLLLQEEIRKRTRDENRKTREVDRMKRKISSRFNKVEVWQLTAVNLHRFQLFIPSIINYLCIFPFAIIELIKKNIAMYIQNIIK